MRRPRLMPSATKRGRSVHPVYREAHLIERIGWLRASVLGANDEILSTASLVVGCLAVLGAISARIGGAGIVKPTLRVTFWCALAIASGRTKVDRAAQQTHGIVDRSIKSTLPLQGGLQWELSD